MNGFEVFIDPDNQGKLIAPYDMKNLMNYLKVPYNDKYLRACHFDTMIKRKIANLVILFKRKGPDTIIRYLETLNRNLTA